MKHAIATLQAAAEAAIVNEPIHRNAGDIAQADLDRAVAEDCTAAIVQLSRPKTILHGDLPPTVGRTVLYTVPECQVGEINRRRTSSHSIAERAKVREWPGGAQAHIGNDVKAGDVFPLIITRVWGDQPGSAFNGQLLLDGNDVYWLTSISIQAEPRPGAAHWPPRV